ENLGALVYERHFNSECREHGRVLQADDARSNDGHRARQAGEREDVVATENNAMVDDDAWWKARRGADRDDDVRCVQQLGAQPVFYLYRVRIVKAPGAFKELDAVALQLRLDDVAFATDDVFATKQQVVRRDVVLAAISTAVHLLLPEPRQVEYRFSK